MIAATMFLATRLLIALWIFGLGPSVPAAFADAIGAEETSATAEQQQYQYDKSTGRDLSFAKSTWPSDHGDSSRSKYTYNAGLPKGFRPEELKIASQTALPKAQWLYTYGDNSGTLFAMSASLSHAWIAKVDAITMEIQQQIDIPTSIYIGGMIMHANGHVYSVHANSVYRFWNGNLHNMTTLNLPTTLNGKMVQTNGGILSSDGYIVVKQWAVNLEDFSTMFGTAVPMLRNLAIAVIVIFTTIAVFLLPRKSSSLPVVLFASLCGALFGILVCTGGLIMLLRRGYGDFDAIKFITTNIPFNNFGGGGELKIIDPISLEIKADLFLNERCSFGRMALSALPNGEDAIVLIGDEFIRQYRWQPATGQLYEVTDWAERYRSRHTGSFPGTGPAIFNGVTYFTDNTFPVTLWGRSYKLFSKALEPDAASGQYGRMQIVPLTDGDESGFMFWSVVISPLEEDVIVWDSANHNVQVRRAHDLSSRYNVTALQGDCITVAADKGHLYYGDYNKGPRRNAPHEWFEAMGPAGKNVYSDLRKYLIVADVATGEVLANLTVQEGGMMGPSLIVPGANNDVFIGGGAGLTRVYV